ncbi:MAG: hypothetical protein J6W88_05840 [Bacteroidales bacterium]|nr:hypothetical protein [Bacteroidales bacterium]
MEFIVSRNALLRALKHARLAIQRTSKGEVPKLFKNFVFTFPDSPQITMLIMPMLLND